MMVFESNYIVLIIPSMLMVVLVMFALNRMSKRIEINSIRAFVRETIEEESIRITISFHCRW